MVFVFQNYSLFMQQVARKEWWSLFPTFFRPWDFLPSHILLLLLWRTRLPRERIRSSQTVRKIVYRSLVSVAGFFDQFSFDGMHLAMHHLALSFSLNTAHLEPSLHNSSISTCFDVSLKNWKITVSYRKQSVNNSKTKINKTVSHLLQSPLVSGLFQGSRYLCTKTRTWGYMSYFRSFGFHSLSEALTSNIIFRDNN